MYLMYVDESGDPGLVNSPTTHYILSGLVVREDQWDDVLKKLIAFRQLMRANYNLKLREEIHAVRFMNKPGNVGHIAKYDRLSILRLELDALAAMQNISIINIAIDKRTKRAPLDVSELAWTYLIQRFENTIKHQNFPGDPHVDPAGRLVFDRGIIFSDNTDEKKLRGIIRRMRVYNPVSNTGGTGYRPLPLTQLIEDISVRDSTESYFVQAVDVVAYFLQQKVRPNKYVKKRGGRNYFDRLAPCLQLKASRTDPLGIVWG